MLTYDLSEWLDPEGEFPRDHPAVRANLEKVARLLRLAVDLPEGGSVLTTMLCSKQLKRQPCGGFLEVRKEADGSVYAQCPRCHLERILITNWQDTPWRDELSQDR